MGRRKGVAAGVGVGGGKGGMEVEEDGDYIPTATLSPPE